MITTVAPQEDRAVKAVATATITKIASLDIGARGIAVGISTTTLPISLTAALSASAKGVRIAAAAPQTGNARSAGEIAITTLTASLA